MKLRGKPEIFNELFNVKGESFSSQAVMVD